jgi:hypothetical protein
MLALSRGASVLVGYMLCLQAQPDAQSARALQVQKWAIEWKEAVQEHRPRELSEPTRSVAMWPWTKLEPVLRRVTAEADPLLLLQGAAMYLDISLLIPLDMRPVYPTEGRSLVGEDGRVEGVQHLDSQIWWGRHLVGVVVERRSISPAERALSVAWFRAVTAQLASQLSLANLTPHLAEGVRRFPDDPGMLFDAGCMEETFASPLIQATAAAHEAKRASVPRNEYSLPYVSSAERHLREAERRLRQALQIDPSAAETRARLGRVVARRGRLAEAIGDLENVARSADDAAVRYYALLFLGEARSGTQRHQPAIEAFTEAAALFPRARAPHLGISRVHSNRGDLDSARAALAPVLGASRKTTDASDDPWWVYDRCAGRDVGRAYETLTRALRDATR